MSALSKGVKSIATTLPRTTITAMASSAPVYEGVFGTVGFYPLQHSSTAD